MSGWFWLASVAAGSYGAMIFLGSVARKVQDGEQRLAALESKLQAVRKRQSQAADETAQPTTVVASALPDAQDTTRAA